MRSYAPQALRYMGARPVNVTNMGKDDPMVQHESPEFTVNVPKSGTISL